jgi:mRNA-degrading endonuclease RelE of RelBE toxin-antitoxin system
MKYQRYETREFSKQLESIRTSDKKTFQRIEDVIKRVLENPSGFDSTLKGPRSGQVKKKVGKFRVVYKYCEYCLQTAKAQCNECAENSIPSDAIVLLEVFRRDEGYD